MSRFYDIQVRNADGTMFREYTSFPSGQNDPGALDIEMDIQTAQFHLIRNIGSYVRIYNIPLKDVAQGTSFNGKTVSIYGGMKPGLPLATATANQAGMLTEGVVYNGFGNWQGTTQTLDLYLRPGTGTHDSPKPYVLNWPASMPLGVALKNCLQTSLPGTAVQINISANLVQAHDELHVTGTLQDMAIFVHGASQGIVNQDSYPGVSMIFANGKVVVDDRTGTQANPKVINFLDLIGQPTWVDVATISVDVVMRGDIDVIDWVKLPPTIITQSNSSLAFARQPNSSFTGVFQVTAIRHIGRFRDASSASWLTNLQIVANPTATGSTTPDANSTAPASTPTPTTSGGSS